MKAIKLSFFEDYGHGWLKVPFSIINKLNIRDKITSFSYMRGGFVYLEEDQDCFLFFDSIESKFGNKLRSEFREKVKHNSSERASKIRNYSSYENIDLKPFEDYREALLNSKNWDKRGVFDIKNATISYLRYWNKEHCHLGFKLQPSK